MGTWPEDIWELRAYLLDLSPFVSTTALKDLVDKSFVPVAIKTEICIANPEATQQDEFMKWAQEYADYPLPAYALASIIASWDERTFRTDMEAQMAEKHANMSQAANNMLQILSRQELPPTIDTLLWVWRQLPTLNARFTEAALLLAQGEPALAEALMDSMYGNLSERDEAERLNMLVLIDALSSAHADNRDANHLTGGEVASLQQLVAQNYDLPTTWAANLLCAVYGHCRPPFTGGGEEERSLQEQTPNDGAATVPGLAVYPNPARSWSAISWDLAGQIGRSELVIRDIGGRELARTTIAAARGQWVWDTRHVVAGAYAVELIHEDRTVDAARLVVEP